ncbi:hypothetical protein, partial [Paenibacillus sp. IITD108]|uniref:hypothetical protein n=1 Tax=Paenibacillus sp. IITD108 TaxID=3116649 RepID=UPI002F40F119
ESGAPPQNVQLYMKFHTHYAKMPQKTQMYMKNHTEMVGATLKRPSVFEISYKGRHLVKKGARSHVALSTIQTHLSRQYFVTKQ